MIVSLRHLLAQAVPGCLENVLVRVEEASRLGTPSGL
jgi:hypothetical protein